jgi:arginine decarboxylase
MARAETNEPGRKIASAVGLAVPEIHTHHGYLSEHCAFDDAAGSCGIYAEELAATMLATIMDSPSDGRIIATRHISASASGDPDGRWTTTVSAAVFIMAS